MIDTLPEYYKDRIQIDPESRCWVWQSSRTAAGYGRRVGQHTTWYTHRLVYELLVGPIPEGLELDHLCMNKPCCNPLHLEPVTHRENILRARLVKGNWNLKRTWNRVRPSHCQRGHELTGGKGCRVCRLASQLRWWNDIGKARREASKGVKV